MATLLAKNADVLVTMDVERRELRGAGLFARDGVIETVGPVTELPATADVVFHNPHTGSLPLPQAIDRFYTSDVFMHTWDLARATGQDDTLDPELCSVLLSGMQPLDEVLRSSGQFGPAVAVPDDADPQSRMIGFIGRDPAWSLTLH